MNTCVSYIEESIYEVTGISLFSQYSYPFLFQFIYYTSILLNVLNWTCITIYSRIPLIQINWDGEPFGYAENPDNWIFL